MSKILSIVTPTFRDDKIAKTYSSIKSLLKHEIVEWIVVDGYESPENELGNKLSNLNHALYINEKDNGIYDAMNKGIDKASGEYLWFLNSGDEMMIKDVLLLDILKQNLNHNAWLKFNFSINSKERNEKINSPFFIFNSPNHQASIVSRELFNNKRYNTKLDLAADYQFFLEVYFKKKIKPKSIHYSLFSYDLEGITAKPEQKNKIRSERIKSVINVLISTLNPFILIVCLVQIFAYFPFIILPSLGIKRFHD